MTNLFGDVMPWFGSASLGAGVAVLVFWTLRQFAARRERFRRIAAARVRSGHLPPEIPTVPGVLDQIKLPGEGLPPAFDLDEAVTVDETPRLHVSYVDGRGSLAQQTVQVEKLDLLRNVILYPDHVEGSIRIIALDRIRVVRNAHTGRAFELGTWVDAVRAARRRRGLRGAFDTYIAA